MAKQPMTKKQMILRTIIVLIGTPLLLLVCLFGYLYLTLPSPQGKRLTWKDKLVGIQSMSYVWLIRTKQGVILVDTGIDQKAEAIKAELKKQKLTPQDVKYVLLTHGHTDHISGLMAFPHAKVWIGPGETKLVAGTVPAGGLMQRTMARFGKPLQLPQTLQELKDGQTLQVAGESFRVIHTPGHTRGSVMYLWGQFLFSGDALFSKKSGVGLLPSIMMENLGLGKLSIRKLKPLSFTDMADGHVGLTTKAHEKVLQFLQ